MLPLSLLLILLMPFLFFSLHLIWTNDIYQDFWTIYCRKLLSSFFFFNFMTLSPSRINGLRYGSYYVSNYHMNILFYVALNKTGLTGLNRLIQELWYLIGIVCFCSCNSIPSKCSQSLKYYCNYCYMEHLHIIRIMPLTSVTELWSQVS